MPDPPRNAAPIAEADHPGPPGAVTPPEPAPTTIKVPCVRRGESIDKPESTIIIPGTVGGKVNGRIIKAWRVQQAAIKASESIMIGKEVIGSTEGLGSEHFADPSPTNEITSLTAPAVTIGVAGQQASLAKELEIVTSHLTIHQVRIHNPVTVILAPDVYQRLQKIEHKPQRLQKRIKNVQLVLDEDLNDLYRRASRPGNEHIVPFLEEFIQIQQNLFTNKIKVITLLGKIVNALGHRNGGEIVQRWKERIDLEKELRQILIELESLKEELAKVAITLSIIEMKKEAYILIRYGDQEQHIPGPLTQTSLQITLSGTSELIGSELLIDQTPLAG